MRSAKAEPLKIMISGAPASGKGTQCQLITQKVCLYVSPTFSVSCYTSFTSSWNKYVEFEKEDFHVFMSGFAPAFRAFSSFINEL